MELFERDRSALKRLRLFAKGNVDVHDSLHSCRLGGTLVWNGINAAFRAQSRNVTARLQHETWTRSDALLAADGTIPHPLASRILPLGVHALKSQFSRAVLDEPADAVVLSIQPDVLSGMLRHRQTGFLLYPSNLDQWSTEDRHWVKSDFDPMPPLDAPQSMENLRTIIAGIRAARDIPILIYNMSAVVPGETIDGYQGLDETLSERIKRFNLGLIDLSRDTGIHIIDADRIVAEHGANTLKRDSVHLTEAGYRLLAHEVARVLSDIGLLEDGI